MKLGTLSNSTRCSSSVRRIRGGRTITGLRGVPYPTASGIRVTAIQTGYLLTNSGPWPRKSRCMLNPQPIADCPPMTPKTFLPYGRQWVDESDIQAVAEVLRSEFLTCGPRVEEF